MIEVRNLTKKYGNHLAVNDLSFTVEDRQVYGFLGPNGAGKSTTMNIMTGYIGMTDGEVIINGHNILTEPKEAKKCIGYLPELPPLYLNMTVREYLKFVAELKGIPKKDRRTEVDTVIEYFSLENVSHRVISTLSKGYRQRVGLAQAIIGSPDVIILDEPTVGLDPKQIIDIRELIKMLSKNHTIIISSHILSEIQEMCDKVIIVHHGKLIAEGKPSELESMLGSSVIELTVKADDDIAARNVFSAIDGVTSTACAQGGKVGEIDVRLTVSAGSDVQSKLYEVCVKENMPILMLKSSEYSLEQLFLELTAEDGVPAEAEDAAAEAQTADPEPPAADGEKKEADE